MAEYFVNSHDEGTHNLFLHVIERLKKQERVKPTHSLSFKQTRGLKNDEVNENRFQRKYDFGRTMSTTMRLAMLHCCGVPSHIWTAHLSDQNQAIVHRFPDVDHHGFQLADNRNDAIRYWSRMDWLYPHFFIEDNLPEPGEDTETSTLKSFLHIIRDNFTEVIEIQCTLAMRRPTDLVYDVSFGVTVTRREINDDQPDEDIFDMFKRLLRDEKLRNIRYVTEDIEEKKQDDDDDDDDDEDDDNDAAVDGNFDNGDGDRLAAEASRLSIK